MRTSRRFIRLASAAILLGGLASLTTNPCLAQPGAAPSAPTVSAANAQVNFSRGVRDVLKMLDAKVDPAVIKAYIGSANITFNPTATEIIALKQRDVPDDLITAMIQRGAEVRMQLAQAAQPGPAVQAPNAPPQGYDYGTAAPGAIAPDYYPYDYAGYGAPYYGYPYSYGYGYPYWYNYSYPWAFSSPFFFNFGFGRGFRDFDRFHRFNGFHGNRSFAVQGRSGFGNRSAWSPAVGAGFRSSSFGHSGFAGSFASGGVRPGGFGGHMGGFAARSGGFAGRGGGSFGGGHGGGGFGGGHGGGHR